MTDGVTGARIEADGRYDSATSAQCVACYGETDLHMISSCGHSICEDCLKMYLEQVMADQTSYPPKCCHKEMLINGKKLEHIVGAVLDGIFSEQYMKKIGDYKEECYTYCANCGLRVHPNSSHMAYCGGCHISTCAWCKEAAEEGHECIIKRSGRKFSEYATKRGMRRCYQCGVWVERVDGCRQVICMCGAEFCIQCGKESEECVCTASPLEGNDNHTSDTTSDATSDWGDTSDEEKITSEGKEDCQNGKQNVGEGENGNYDREEDIDDGAEIINDKEQELEENITDRGTDASNGEGELL